MHPFIFIIIALVVIYLFVNYQRQQSQFSQDSGSSELAVNGPANSDQSFAFISKGKLFVWTKEKQLEQVHSPHVQEMIDRMQRRKQIHGWKDNTSLSTSFTGQGSDTTGDQVELKVVSAQFTDDNKLIYFMSDKNVGGLFKYDVADKNERRLLHRQNLNLENLTLSPDGKHLLCSQQHANGIADIVMLDNEGNDFRQLTEGDTEDSAPSWLPGEDNQILYQSSGLARSDEGYVVATGPASIKLLDLDNNEVTPVMDDPKFDFMQPKVDKQGNLYYIRRPYEVQQYKGGNVLLDTILFPFRLVRAIFHYLNFFSLMYSRKPLTTASGPEVKADLKDILIKGKRIDAEKALRKESRVNGIPSLVPSSWQLVKRSQTGEEWVLARNVASFDITSEDAILYSNGYAVFGLSTGNCNVLLRDKYIADVIAY